MHHGPAVKLKKDAATPFKQRLGVIMFFIYGAIYAGFVGINVMAPALMEKRVLLGMNLACVYGFGLIVIALVLALIYNQKCLALEAKYNSDKNGKGENQ